MEWRGLGDRDGESIMQPGLLSACSLVEDRLRSTGHLPLFLAISGSHIYGLETEASDIDVRGVYLDPLNRILSLHPERDTVEGIEGKVDFQCYELGKTLGMLLKNNGNIVRLLLSPLVGYSTASIDWKGIATHYLTKELSHYYKGYAFGQRKRAFSNRGGKALIYTYLEIFQGLVLMRYSRLENDFKLLWQACVEVGWYPRNGLLNYYFTHRDEPVSEDKWNQFFIEWDLLCEKLDVETIHSKLPDKYDGYKMLNELLYKWRVQTLYD